MPSILAYGAEALAQRLQKQRHRRNNKSDCVHPSSWESEPAAERIVETMDDLCQRLRENKLRTLSIGWNESDFIRSDKSVAVLEKAWQRNRSVTDVSIGFKIGQSNNYKAVIVDGGTTVDGGGGGHHAGIPVHTRNRRLLCLTLDRLLATKSPHYILSLRLVLDDWIPEHLLHAILNLHVHLQSIEFHGVTCRRSIYAGRGHNNERQTQSLRSDSGGFSPAAVTENYLSLRSEFAAPPAAKRLLQKKKKKKKRRGVADMSMLKTQNGGGGGAEGKRTEAVDIVSVVMPHLVRVNSPLKSLKLVDCGLIDEDISFLVNAIQGKELASLSIRSNRYLTGTGVMELCSSSSICGELDLSLCDFNCFDGPAIGAALARRNKPLKKLLLCGNYQLDVPGLVALVQPGVLHKVQALDLSYCELGNGRTTRLVEQVAESHASFATALRELKLQGCNISSNVSRQALIRLLSLPHSRIRRLILNDPVESGKYWATKGLKEVAAVLPLNYDLEELSLDYMQTQPNANVWQNDILPWLEWNRLGRRVVLPGREVSASEWIDSIHRASRKDLDTLYWFVRQSTELLGAN